MKFILKIGGSLLFSADQKLDLHQFQEYAQIIRQLRQEGHNLVLVVGGGAFAKKLVEKGKRLGANRDALDQLGIAATWVCAQLMIAALEDIAHSTPIMTEEQLTQLIGVDELLVLGGLHPRQSTNAVAARVAELVEAKTLVNVTDVDGVYERDPKQSPDSKLISEMTISELRKIVSPLTNEPGAYPLFDQRALDIIERGKVELWFVNGKPAQNILYAINEGKIGTRVTIS
jgi:uridylate kinase